MIKAYLLVKLLTYLYVLDIEKLVETMLYQIQFSNKFFIGNLRQYIIYKYIYIFFRDLNNMFLIS